MLVLLLLIGITAANTYSLEKPFYDLKNVEVMFKDFAEKFDKKYENEQEYARRLKIFEENLNDINKRNSKHPDTVFAVNRFSDMNFKEFANTYLGYNKSGGSEFETVEFVPSGQEPDSLDYRDQGIVTEVKNQGGCGSCYIFSAIGNIEGQYAMKHQQLISLSEQEGLDCAVSTGCKGGSILDVMNGLVSTGVEKEEDYPYEEAKGQCRADKSKTVVNVVGGQQLNTNGETGLAQALAETGPLSIGLTASPSFQQYHSGVLTPDDCVPNVDPHAVLLVGYGTDSESGKQFWLIKNSWGVDHGEQGYWRVERGKGLCSIGDEVVSANVQ